MASILVVEDDEDVRPLICAMLVKAGHTVRQAGNGVEGIKLYREESADLVITDVVMPEKEGLGMIVDLRRINPKVRIVAMSGGFAYDPKLYLHMATSLGADRVLRKPFQFQDLMDAVNAVLPAAPHAPPA